MIGYKKSVKKLELAFNPKIKNMCVPSTVVSIAPSALDWFGYGVRYRSSQAPALVRTALPLSQAQAPELVGQRSHYRPPNLSLGLSTFVSERSTPTPVKLTQHGSVVQNGVRFKISFNKMGSVKLSLTP